MTEERAREAVAKAAELLSHRAHSTSSLQKRLMEKGFEEDEAAYAVSRLCELQLLDDAAYAEELYRVCRAKGYGLMRVRQELRKRGVPQEIAEAALADFEPEEAELVRFLKTKLRGSTDRAAVKRATDALFRRGFGWEEISAALAALQREWEEESGEI